MNTTRGNEITVNVSHSSCFLDHLLSNDKNMHYKARGFIVITTIIITKLRSFHNSFIGTSLTLLVFFASDCDRLHECKQKLDLDENWLVRITAQAALNYLWIILHHIRDQIEG